MSTGLVILPSRHARGWSCLVGTRSTQISAPSHSVGLFEHRYASLKNPLVIKCRPRGSPCSTHDRLYNTGKTCAVPVPKRLGKYFRLFDLLESSSMLAAESPTLCRLSSSHPVEAHGDPGLEPSTCEYVVAVSESVYRYCSISLRLLDPEQFPFEGKGCPQYSNLPDVLSTLCPLGSLELSPRDVLSVDVLSMNMQNKEAIVYPETSPLFSPLRRWACMASTHGFHASTM